MLGRSVVPGPLGDEVRDDVGRGGVPHPGVGIRSRHAVRGVLGRAARRLGRLGHDRHRTATRFVAALALTAAAVTGPALLAPAHAAKEAPKSTFTVALLNDVDSFNPFKGYLAESYEMWALMYDYMTGYK